MKLLSALLLSTTLAAVAPAWGQVNTIPSQPHLLVKGSATRTVMPDRFTVKVALESVDMQTDTARAACRPMPNACCSCSPSTAPSRAPCVPPT